MADWQHNASTGDDILDIASNARIIRLAGGGIYYCEYWGDYSPNFPRRGACRTTLQAAKRDLSRLKRA